MAVEEYICGIVSGGDKAPLDGIEECGLVIACDRGYTHLCEEGIEADLFVGDFDSCDEVTLDNIPRLELEKEKDDTDTLAAIRFALGQGITGNNLAIEIVDTFLDTPFSNGANHIRRVAKLS